MKGEKTLTKLKAVFDCVEDKELIAELNKIGNIHQSQISRWRKVGIPRASEIIIQRLLLEIDNLRGQMDKQ